MGADGRGVKFDPLVDYIGLGGGYSSLLGWSRVPIHHNLQERAASSQSTGARRLGVSCLSWNRRELVALLPHHARLPTARPHGLQQPGNGEL